MNLQILIEQYITFQQSLGLPFRANAKALRRFCRANGPRVDIAAVRPKQINSFLWGGGPRTWYTKLAILRPFYRYAISRGYVDATPLPTTIPQRPPPFVPYIYSHEELRSLVELAGVNQRRRTRLEPITMRTVLLLLYGTGLRVGEALNLNCADVDSVVSGSF
jgi:integrase/recombinase XerD